MCFPEGRSINLWEDELKTARLIARLRLRSRLHGFSLLLSDDCRGVGADADDELVSERWAAHRVDALRGHRRPVVCCRANECAQEAPDRCTEAVRRSGPPVCSKSSPAPCPCPTALLRQSRPRWRASCRGAASLIRTRGRWPRLLGEGRFVSKFGLFC